MSDGPRLEGVLIDCDGTLVDTETLWTIAERRTLERWGASLSREFELAMVGQSVRSCAGLLAEHVGVPDDADAIYHELLSEYDRVLENVPVDPLPGAEQVMRGLAARGITTVVVSNSLERHVLAALESSGLIGWAGNVQSPGPGIASKPAPDLYLAACKRWSIPQQSAVAIEDSQVGLDAARAAGLFTVAVPSVPGAQLQADMTFSSLADIDLVQLERRIIAPSSAA